MMGTGRGRGWGGEGGSPGYGAVLRGATLPLLHN